MISECRMLSESREAGGRGINRGIEPMRELQFVEGFHERENESRAEKKRE